MAVRIQKSAVNIREKLAELERPIGVNGAALMATNTPQEAFSLIGAGRKNRIINGSMRIDQRYSGTLLSSANGFIVDRWTGNWYAPAGGSYSGQQVSDAPAGFRNSLRITTTATPSNNTDSYFQIFQIIEGYNIADLMMGTANAKTFTCSFWVKSSITGTYSICFFNNQSTVRSYITTYSINSANTWEYKTITVPGDTSTTGTWGNTNGQGLGVFFDMGSGTNQESTANTWATLNTRRVAGTVRLINTNGATWQVTGVQLEEGKVATPFEYYSYNEEFALCQRYYEKSFEDSTVPALGANTTSFSTEVALSWGWAGHRSGYPTNQYPGRSTFVKFRVPKRTSPSVSLYGNSAGYPYIYDTTNGGRWVTANWGVYNSKEGFEMGNEFTSTFQNWAFCHWTAAAELS